MLIRSGTLSSRASLSLFLPFNQLPKLRKPVRCYCYSSENHINRGSIIADVAAFSYPGIAKIILKKGKAKFFHDGHPMVYSGAVDRIVGQPFPKSGDIVLVTDVSERPFAWGLYNSTSMFAVRLMQMEEDANRDPTCVLNMENLLESRIHSAVDLRMQLGLPRADTNAYRLVNSEGDRLSGLIVDVFSDHAVIASSAAWVERYRPLIEMLVRNTPGINHVKWRPSIEMLKEEGLDMDFVDTKPMPVQSSIKVKENGVYYSISLHGQKTGFYVDQRDNRRFVGSVSKGRKVLDVCCYSGGFSLNAAMGGAVHVTGIDSSLSALKLAEENIRLNNIDSNRISFLKEDASKFMKAAALEQKSWDIVVLDPPKLAPSRKALPRASRMYYNLNALAMRLTRKGGLLLTCSCSAAMTQSGTFLSVLQKAASSVGKRITVLRQGGAPADHPIDPAYPENTYFTSILLRVL
eukprot:TRINITY_DN5179_c0_g1_i1.p1 TRINITY_DN5179_c0_g1~~TRINITY_DN5179_c0_g1_i1.p1  ORF type:complete len:463 (-),score=77.35 TRINITY_DN5179_c0_g1_i1:179-1567(-)